MVLNPIGETDGDSALLFPKSGEPDVLTQVALDKLGEYQAAASTVKKLAWGLGGTVVSAVALLAASMALRATGICPEPLGWILMAAAAGGGLIGAGIIAWKLGGAEGKQLVARETFKNNVESKLKELAEADVETRAKAITDKLNSYGVKIWKAEEITILLTPAA